MRPRICRIFPSSYARSVCVRTFTGWDDVQPGFFGADLVAHRGPWAEGAFLQTLVLTDVATSWTECLALPYRSQHSDIQALDRARTLQRELTAARSVVRPGFRSGNTGDPYSALLVSVRVIQRKPRWQVAESIASACRAAGR